MLEEGDMYTDGKLFEAKLEVTRSGVERAEQAKRAD